MESHASSSSAQAGGDLHVGGDIIGRDKISVTTVIYGNQPFTNLVGQNTSNGWPQISAVKWRKYFDNLTGGRYVKAMNIAGYQEPRTMEGQLLASEVRNFLSLDNENLFVIEARAGYGKTKLLRRLVFELATNARPYLTNLDPNKPPPTGIIIHHELSHTRFGENDTLANRLAEWLNAQGAFGSSLFSYVPDLFSHPDANWIVCLDAIDELPSGNDVRLFRELLQQFHGFFPQVKVVVTSRPDGISGWQHHGRAAQMASMQESEWRNYLASVLGNDVDRAELFLKEHPKFQELVVVPLYLDAYSKAITSLPDEVEASDFLQADFQRYRWQRAARIVEVFSRWVARFFSRNPHQPLRERSLMLEDFVAGISEPIIEQTDGEVQILQPIETAQEPGAESKPPLQAAVLRQIVEAMWDHDSKNDGAVISEIERRTPLRAIKALAAEVDGRASVTVDQAQNISPLTIQHLGRFLSLGLLNREAEKLRFGIRLLQLYLAASHIQYLWESSQEQDVTRLTRDWNNFWRDAFLLLRDIAQDPELLNFIEQNLAEKSARLHVDRSSL